MRKLLLSVICFCLINFLMQSCLAKEVCANCNWGTDCGSITTRQVVTLGLVNKNPGIERNDSGPFLAFACGNGTQLGVLWTEGTCDQTGGLSGLAASQFPGIYDKPQCRYGS